jgi:hypothetical protein
MAKIVLKKAVRPAPHVAPLREQKSTDPTVRTYRALTRLMVGDNSPQGYHYRQFGDFVPEAEQWRNLGIYLKGQQIEIAYVNKSELDLWAEEFLHRCEVEDAEKAAQTSLEEEELELKRKLAEVQKKKALENSGGGPIKEVDESFKPDKTIVQPIDFGGVKMNGGGAPRPVAIPRPTREVPAQKNTAENRTRPTTVRRKKG